MCWVKYLEGYCADLINLSELDDGLDKLPKDANDCSLVFVGRYKGSDCVVGLSNGGSGYLMIGTIKMYVYVSNKLVLDCCIAS